MKCILDLCFFSPFFYLICVYDILWNYSRLMNKIDEHILHSSFRSLHIRQTHTRICGIRQPRTHSTWWQDDIEEPFFSTNKKDDENSLLALLVCSSILSLSISLNILQKKIVCCLAFSASSFVLTGKYECNTTHNPRQKMIYLKKSIFCMFSMWKLKTYRTFWISSDFSAQ